MSQENNRNLPPSTIQRLLMPFRGGLSKACPSHHYHWTCRQHLTAVDPIINRNETEDDKRRSDSWTTRLRTTPHSDLQLESWPPHRKQQIHRKSSCRRSYYTTTAVPYIFTAAPSTRPRKQAQAYQNLHTYLKSSHLELSELRSVVGGAVSELYMYIVPVANWFKSIGSWDCIY